MSSLKLANVSCPSCGSNQVWKDGMRYVQKGSIQRYLCRDCGYRFSHSPQSGSKLLRQVSKVDTQSLNRRSAYPSSRQVCELLTEESKNLAEVTRQETAQREGTAHTVDAKGIIIEHVWWLQKQGYKESTIIGRSRLLKTLVQRGADLLDPESVKGVIAKQQGWSEGRKELAVEAYTTFLKMAGGKWDKPKYKRIQRLPWIPTESEIDQLIAATSPRIGTFLLLLKETGMRPGEAWKLKWADLDTVARTINITAEKNSNPRIFKLSNNLAERLSQLPKHSEKIFGNAQQEHHRHNFSLQRRNIADKLKNPRLKQISFKTLRHWKATMEYHRTKDILHVMNVLGHKNIKNTLIYTHLVNLEGDDYVSKVAWNLEEACKLVDAGFDYVTDVEGARIFRKRK